HVAPIQLGDSQGEARAAEAVFLLDGASWGPLDGVSRIFVLFDGRDPDNVTHARQQWRVAKEAGLSPTYWRQGEDGRWAKNG
ncbi:MAG: DNA polymerase III subunit chi, partial [Hyphomonadaceae bacterium]